MSPSPPRSGPATAVAALTTVVGLLLAGLAAPTSAAVPSRVLGADEAGSDVVLRPAVLRAEEGRAQVEVALGGDAPGDVVVDLTLREPSVAPDGTVTGGPPATAGRITRGGRLRPGEVLRADLTGVTAPLVVAGTVRPAGDDPDVPPTATLQALVLPGRPGPPPTATLEVVDGQLRATVASTAPLLVTARLRGAAAVTHPDRLVLPGQPLVLTGEPARWPSPSELAVTDEAGRTVTVSTSRTALTLLAVALVLAATGALALLLRRRRGRATTG